MNTAPEEFKQKARELLPKVQGQVGPEDEDLRKSLLKFIGDFANWDLSSDRTYLEVSRGLVKAAHPEETPLVVDPFAGGGSIPLEALRLGCEAFASDLNPVACLILKVMLEDIPRHGPKLADELRRVGAEIKKEAEKELAEFYPTGPGRRDANRLPVGTHRALRVAGLRRGDSADAVLLAVQKSESQEGATVSSQKAKGNGQKPGDRIRDLRAEERSGSAARDGDPC